MGETMKRLLTIAAMALCATMTTRAQQPIGGSLQSYSYPPGWVFTPEMGFGETYDDNIGLFGESSGATTTDDVVQTWQPGADLHFSGRHTEFGVGYNGSFLNYQTFSTLNRWSQHGRLTFKRQETARLKWSGHANVLAVPSTDFVDVGGVPFRRTGAVTSDGRGSVEYAISGRDSFFGEGAFQTIHFEEPLSVDNILHGGHIYEFSGGWRHKLSSRFGVGADYALRQARVVGGIQPFDLHSFEGGATYQLSPSWTLDGSGGVVYMATNTGVTESRFGPAWRAALERNRAERTLRIEYLRSYIPSFGVGGTLRSEEASISFRTPLFHSRRFYTEQRLLYRDDEPITQVFEQLPLRSLRTHSMIGWAPQRWVRIEGFYAHTQQTNRLVLGQLYRNRIGIQIVTSKPMRIQ